MFVRSAVRPPEPSTASPETSQCFASMEPSVALLPTPSATTSAPSTAAPVATMPFAYFMAFLLRVVYRGEDYDGFRLPRYQGRRRDPNPRPPAYGAGELRDCSTPPDSEA